MTSRSLHSDVCNLPSCSGIGPSCPDQCGSSSNGISPSSSRSSHIHFPSPATNFSSPSSRDSEAQLREDEEFLGPPLHDPRFHASRILSTATTAATTSAPSGVPGGNRPPTATLSFRRHTADFGRPSFPPRPSISINPPQSSSNADTDFNSGSLSPWAKPILCRTVSGSIMQCAAVSLPSPSSSCSTSSSSSFSIADFRDLAKEVQEAFPNSGYNSELEALKALNQYNRSSKAHGREGPIRIMVAVDGEPECLEALDWALANVIKGHRVLSLVHVLPPFVYDDSASVDNMMLDMAWLIEQELRLAREHIIEAAQQERRDKANLMLNTLRDQIVRDHQLDVETYVLEGDVAQLLSETAEKLQPEKVIMGRCRRSRFQRVLGGNGVSDQCIRQIKKEIMVLAIRKKRAGGYSVTSRVKKDFWLLA